MKGMSIAVLARQMNKPAVTLTAVVIALILGSMHASFIQYLRPVGEFYVALLQICVLPFLLTTIPLAVRSAMTSGTAGHVMRRLAIWTTVAVAAVMLAAVLVPSAIFHFFSIDEHTIARIGAFVGNSNDRVDIEFAIDPLRASVLSTVADKGLIALIPTNIFAALSNNDSMRVLVFAGVFGIAMVLVERHSGSSIFDEFRHIQLVCIRIFDWFSLLVPLGIVALIAPQVDQLGPDIFAVVAMFAYAFIAVCLVVLVGAVAVVAVALRLSPAAAFASLLKPMMLGAATRNTLICIPLALETMRDEMKAANDPCELFIPLGFATLRFGTILYFIIATLFMGALMGRGFSVLDLMEIAGLATAASFATLGVTGLAALSPLAAVLRPFGLSYELAVPLMVIIDPIANMVRVMVNVAVNCAIPALAGGRATPVAVAPVGGLAAASTCRLDKNFD